MSAPDAGETTAVGLVRAAVALGAAALVTRGELAAVEMTEARERAGRWLVLALLGAALVLAALLVATLLVVSFFWDSHRTAAIAAVAVVYGVAGAGLLGWLLARLKSAPPLLQSTLAELKQDCAALRSGRDGAR